MTPPRSSGGSKLSRILSALNPMTWRRRLDLDTRTFLMMLKGALPPTIVIAIYQSSSIADITLTIGYLSALISVLSQALMPRAKFMKIIFFDLLSTCVSASLCCLAIYCAVKAREHNTPRDASDSVCNGFSSDACAVSAIWLIFMIWGANTIRAWKPLELQDPMVAFSIFCSVTITRAGTFVTLSEGLSFVSRLLKGFLLGFAIATGISLFILPITSRGHVFEDIRGYVTQIDAVLQAQIVFVGETPHLWTGEKSLLSRTRTARSGWDAGNNAESDLESRKKSLAAAVTKLNALHGKLQSDMFYSKDEIAWGKLADEDLNTIGGLLRSLLLPLSGMAMLPDILEMIVKTEGTRNNSTLSDENNEEVSRKQAELQKATETLYERLVESARLVKVGLQYFLLGLELKKKRQLEKRSKQDEEAMGDLLNPLQEGFSALFQQQVTQYYSQRKDLTGKLASLEAFSVSEKTDVASANDSERAVAADPDVRQEFFMILYMGHLQDSILKATLDLIEFADNKIEDGTMKRSRLIFPKQRTILQWLSPGSEQKESGVTGDRRQSSHVSPSAVYEEREADTFPDPEHLPPVNLIEKGSILLRVISKVIRSEQSIFGFRVAAAAFCVGILAFLRQTQEFFIHQRCIWAMIVIVIGMNPTSGQTMFGFVARIAATVVSMVLSLIVWYIVDGKTAGVIVFLYLGNVFEYYFYIKVPQYFGATVIAIVTFNVIVGYELQVRKLGIEVATSNGQPYYPIYIFGPYKLAAVAAGCAISFFWVIFPYPITAKSTLRKALGRGLFVLAKFYSCMHTTIELWLNGELGSLHDVRSASHHLDHTRHKIFKEEMILLNSLRMHSHFTTFEPPIGGKFPKPTYDRIIGQIQRMLTSMALMAHTTQSLDALAVAGGSDGNTSAAAENNKWVARLASIALQSAGFRSHQVTSLLCHLSAAMMNAQPLPPYLSTGDSFPLARELQRIDGELLSIRHLEDPAFSTFVCLEVLRSVVSFTLDDLLRDVRSLVGELSFDFHVRHAQDYAESQRLMSEGDA
ncbi:uncharacterized protein BP01DRAFT_378358 [Aspergillus saccharolyticus JOP 1030-1]|uniref:ER transporter 6TM N-terminal domain-containing protein n=1 Tax=Aspergillus saccharolyticus JOP 1030-1 TaxID=1450539 RepID=A0A318ZRP9_9EURO|nr:hypothetical protein BP01DRAFT_378358 [Aspergillus saccharolyticus JOP 1030-1]PYH49747.1 hypothetical protein BP01DRAFT_378358 [Aspergillus saccharolyticus JOP 1030-1]